MRRVWITWEIQRRNKSMARATGSELYEITYNGKSRALRYIYCTYATLKVIFNVRPQVIFYQNPSLALACLLTLLKSVRLLNCSLIGDYHNAGLYPSTGKPLTRWAARQSTRVIVTNSALARKVQEWGAVPFVMPDPLPSLSHIPASEKKSRATDSQALQILFICSWSSDEPIAEVVAAAAQLLNALPAHIYITGKPKSQYDHLFFPKNITRTGYMSTKDFDALLFLSDIVIDLTTRPDCMVCGAYEAVAAKKPILLSNNEATKKYFYKGTEFTDNSAEDIAEKIIKISHSLNQYKIEIEELNIEIYREEEKTIQSLNNLIANE